MCVRTSDLTLTDMLRALSTSLRFSLLFLWPAFLPVVAETVESTSPLWMQVSPIPGAGEFRTLAGFAGDEQMFVLRHIAPGGIITGAAAWVGLGCGILGGM